MNNNKEKELQGLKESLIRKFTRNRSEQHWKKY